MTRIAIMTGAAAGIRQALATALIARGDTVVATPMADRPGFRLADSGIPLAALPFSVKGGRPWPP